MLIAFGLAVALWFGVSAEATTQQTVSTRLVVHNLDARYVLTSPVPDDVDVVFQGPGRELLRLGFSKPRLVYTIESVRSREQDVELRPDMVTVAEGVNARPVQVPKAVLRLRFEPALERRVRVAPRVEVAPAEGFALAGPLKVTPARVMVRGGESAVRAIDTVWTVPFRLENVEGPTTREVELLRPDVEGPLDFLDPSGNLPIASVRVEVVAEPAAERELADVPVRLLGSGSQLWGTEPSAVRVTIRGPQSAVFRVVAQDVEARVHVNGGEQPGEWRAVEVHVPNPYVHASAADSVRLVTRG